MSIRDWCDHNQHHNTPHHDSAQHRDSHSGTGKMPRTEEGHVARSEDGQKYSTSYTAPEPQMHGYPGGIRRQSYVGMQSGGEQQDNCPAESFRSMVATQHGGEKGNIPRKN